MQSFFFFATILFLVSCSDSGSSKKFSGTDSLVINFNIPDTDTIAKTITTIEPKAIKKLAGFIDGKTDKIFKCGYDGNLMFYKKGKLNSDVSFNFSGDECHHFMMINNNELIPTAMSNEAADFLKSLAQGKAWY
ncbi:MAG: hypothetical protein ABIU11_08210 [Chitinophagaceae bacterium]